MPFEFDFGFETPGSGMDNARIAFLFACPGEQGDLGAASGPLAIAHASRYVEYFEMQIGISPLEMGVHSQVLGAPSLAGTVWDSFPANHRPHTLPVVIGEDRKITEQVCGPPLVALWGKMGREEADEFAILNANTTVLAGIRAASSTAFKALPGNVTILTSHTVHKDKTMLAEAFGELHDPVHLSIDLDVLSPGAAHTKRSVEPGGLSWYDLMDITEMVFHSPGVVSVDLVGTKHIEPKSTAALVGAQILMRVAGLAAAVSAQ
jgi:arginase family enzyme